MSRAVAYEQVWYVEPLVVDRGLVEDLLRELYRLSLVLGYHKRTEMGVVDDGVAPLAKVVVRDRDLVGDTIDGIRQILDEVAHNVLPHPLLGCQSHEGLADTVEDLVLVVFFSNFELKIRQIHRCGFFIRKKQSSERRHKSK